ncbi:MAG: polyprenyl synthetase [Candidatus Marinimicrobia bacterium]|nr:polyprenyl synthetase [Candidatus Neomarinimicrobiota bacterium]|tara:strand:- start:668 stop:1648 length:981 start_codon:yes stop_codon:yes gene_type:complete
MNNLNSKINEISKLIKEDFEKFEETFESTLNSNVNLINKVIKYISKKKGKQLRPTLTLLCARITGIPNQNTYYAAALVEILHIATLIHDDVVDESNLRRGWPSVNRIWKNKISILVGDYMFSKALSNMIYLRDFDALDLLSSTAERLSQGEILQIEKAIKKEMTEATYYKMISDKTGSLFSSACKLGGITVNTSEEKLNALYQFGEYLGICFQIKDDLFDVIGKLDEVGKPIGFDVKKNMLTLPFIHLIKNSRNKKNLISKIKYHAKKNDLKNIRAMIINSGSLDYTNQQLKKFTNLAEKEISIFSNSYEKEALINILNFNLKRNY